MAPLKLNAILNGFSQCKGEAVRFVRDELLSVFGIAPPDDSADFYSGKLSNILLSESNLFLDRAVYQACTVRPLIREGKFSWAAATAYYSSYFSICSLVRLHGKAITWVDGSSYLVLTDDLASGRYSVQKTRLRGGSHQHLWSVYNRLYDTVELTPMEFLDVRADDSHPEIVKRNTTTYTLGFGYDEFYWDSRRINREVKRLAADVFANRQASLRDEDLSLQYRAELRIKLICKMLDLIASHSDFRSYHEARVKKRKDFINRSNCEPAWQAKVIGWIEGGD